MNAKKELYRAIYTLLQRYSIKQITINEILEESEVSRSTFYRYFRDKYDLMNWYYGSYVREHIFSTAQSWKQVVLESAGFMAENKEFITHAARYEGQNSFFDFLLELYFEFCKNMCREHFGRGVSQAEEWIIDSHSNGAVCIFAHWVRSEMELPPKEVVELLEQSLPLYLREALL